MFAKRLSKAGNVEMAMALGWSTKMGMEMEMERSWELQMELKLNLNLRLEDRQRRHRSHHHTRTWHQITDSGVHSSASVTQSRVPLRFWAVSFRFLARLRFACLQLLKQLEMAVKGALID